MRFPTTDKKSQTQEEEAEKEMIDFGVQVEQPVQPVVKIEEKVKEEGIVFDKLRIDLENILEPFSKPQDSIENFQTFQKVEARVLAPYSLFAYRDSKNYVIYNSSGVNGSTDVLNVIKDGKLLYHTSKCKH